MSRSVRIVVVFITFFIVTGWIGFFSQSDPLALSSFSPASSGTAGQQLHLKRLQWAPKETQPLLHKKETHTILNELYFLQMLPNPPAPNLTNAECESLFRGENISAKEEYEKGSRNVSTSSELLHSVLSKTENCTDYIWNSGFLFPKVSEEELLFPLAFSLLVSKDLEQVERLLRAVYRPHNVYCVHADKKSSDTFIAGLRMMVNCLPNVFLLDRSVDVEWGTFSALQPEVDCMRRAFELNRKWKYFINLKGQEFPLKTNKELVRILTALRWANDITGKQEEEFIFRWARQLPAPHNLTISMGDVHVLASRGYVNYVINSPVARDFLEWLRPTFIPVETFFSTMNHNPQLGVWGSYTRSLKTKEKKDSIRSYKMWIYENDTCSGKWGRFVCHFGVGDLPLLTSSPFLIANKFSYDYQPLGYDCLEKWYFGKVLRENQDPEAALSALNTSLYENMDLVRYRYTGPVLIW